MELQSQKVVLFGAKLYLCSPMQLGTQTALQVWWFLGLRVGAGWGEVGEVPAEQHFLSWLFGLAAFGAGLAQAG